MVKNKILNQRTFKQRWVYWDNLVLYRFYQVLSNNKNGRDPIINFVWIWRHSTCNTRKEAISNINKVKNITGVYWSLDSIQYIHWYTESITSLKPVSKSERWRRMTWHCVVVPVVVQCWTVISLHWFYGIHTTFSAFKPITNLNSVFMSYTPQRLCD